MFGKNAYDFCFKDVFTLVSEEKTDVKQGSEQKQVASTTASSSNGKSHKKSEKTRKVMYRT